MSMFMKDRDYNSWLLENRIKAELNKMCLWNTDVPEWQLQGHMVNIFSTAGKVLSHG